MIIVFKVVDKTKNVNNKSDLFRGSVGGTLIVLTADKDKTKKSILSAFCFFLFCFLKVSRGTRLNHYCVY